MKTMPRESRHQELTENPSKPFIKDILIDLDIINTQFNSRDALKIKLEMVESITNEINKAL